MLYDLAFLLMDLCERGLIQAANVVFNRYLNEAHRTEDLDGLAALPFFLIDARGDPRQSDGGAHGTRRDGGPSPHCRGGARLFRFRAARNRAAEAAFIAVGGLSGTGKTRLARALAPPIGPMPGAVIVRSDVERKALFGVGETEKLPGDAYSAAVNARVYAVLADKARRILGAGHAAIVDAVFAQPSERAALAATSKAAQVPLQGLFLTANLQARLARVDTRRSDASDATRDVARAQENYDLGALDWRQIDASGAPEETAATARAALD